MNTLLFLCGAGVGALVTTIFLWIMLSALASMRKEERERVMKQHDDLMKCHLDRNKTFEAMLDLFATTKRDLMR